MKTQAPSLDVAIAGVHLALAFMRGTVLRWSHERPSTPGFYWFRDGRDAWPQVVEIKYDFSEKEIPLVVQEQRPERGGVQYLNHISFNGCQWAGPLTLPNEP